MQCRRAGFISAWVVLLVLVSWLSLRRFDSFQLGTYRDDARYVLLARSLVVNHSYAYDYMPGPPRATKYSFGFPLLLAPFVWWWPDDLAAGRVLALVATLVNVSLLFGGWRLFARNASMWQGPAVAALYGLSPVVIAHSRVIMSEPIFTTFCLTALVCAECCARRPRWYVMFGLGASLAAAFCIRATGLLLCVAVAIRFARASSRARARHFLAAILVACAVIAAVILLTPIRAADLLPQQYVLELAGRWAGTDQRMSASPSSHADHIVIIENIRALLIPFGGGSREAALAHRLGVDGLPFVLCAVVTLIVLLGLRESYRTAHWSVAVIVFETLHLAILAIWSRPGTRLLYPIQPFLACQLVLGVGWVARTMKDSRRFVTLCVVTTWGTLAVLSTWASATRVDSRQCVRDFRVGTEWLRSHSASDAIVMANEPPVVHLYAARKTVDFPPTDSADALERSITNQHVDYVLLGPRLEWNVSGALRYDEALTNALGRLVELEQRGRLTVVYESTPDKVIVYRVVPKGSASEAASEDRGYTDSNRGFALIR